MCSTQGRMIANESELNRGIAPPAIMQAPSQTIILITDCDF